MFNFWWSAEWSEWQTLTKTQKSEKRPPMSMKNKMFVYGWRSTFDDQLSDLSNKCWLKCKKKKQTNKRPPMSSKNKMLIFGLCSTSDDQPSDLSDKCWPKCKKMKKGPLCHWKIRCSLLDYVQLLMIGRVIWASNIDWNAKKKKQTNKRPPLVIKK